jgi:hypothetical protein
MRLLTATCSSLRNEETGSRGTVGAFEERDVIVAIGESRFHWRSGFERLLLWFFAVIYALIKMPRQPPRLLGSKGER